MRACHEHEIISSITQESISSESQIKLGRGSSDKKKLAYSVSPAVTHKDNKRTVILFHIILNEDPETRI